MKMTRSEFDLQFEESLKELLEGMAQHPDISAEKFYRMTYFFENLAFFSPVFYGLIEKQGEEDNNSNVNQGQ